MKNKILLVGLFCCSLVSTEAQVLLDKNAGKNSFPIVSPAANVVVCFDGKDETVVRKSVTLFAGRRSSCDGTGPENTSK